MIKVIDYGMGNCGSIKNMLRHLGADCEVVTQPSDLVGASAIVLPGVGSFDHGVKHLQPFREVLNQLVIERKIPFLGVCLGMQLLLEGSDEGELPGMGWITGHAVKFSFPSLEDTKKLVVPHMGWNEVWPSLHNELLGSLPEGRERFYFVHSYHASQIHEDNVMAWCHYGYDFVCAIQKGNIMGAQFHPEKSHKFGKAMFSRFIELSQC